MPLVDVAVCETCGRALGQRHVVTTPRPSLEELEQATSDAICPATDGCTVEPDGICEHGHQSWLRLLGWI